MKVEVAVLGSPSLIVLNIGLCGNTKGQPFACLDSQFYCEIFQEAHFTFRLRSSSGYSSGGDDNCIVNNDTIQPMTRGGGD